MSSSTLTRDPEAFRREYLNEPEWEFLFVGGPWHGQFHKVTGRVVLVPEGRDQPMAWVGDSVKPLPQGSFYSIAYGPMRLKNGREVMSCVSDADTESWWSRESFSEVNDHRLGGEVRREVEDRLRKLAVRVTYRNDWATDTVTFSGVSRKYPTICLFFRMRYADRRSHWEIGADICLRWCDALAQSRPE